MQGVYQFVSCWWHSFSFLRLKLFLFVSAALLSVAPNYLLSLQIQSSAFPDTMDNHDLPSDSDSSDEDFVPEGMFMPMY